MSESRSTVSRLTCFLVWLKHHAQNGVCSMRMVNVANLLVVTELLVQIRGEHCTEICGVQTFRKCRGSVIRPVLRLNQLRVTLEALEGEPH